MLPRQVRRIGEVERGVIYEPHMENGPIWDIIANDIVRHDAMRDFETFLPMSKSSMLMLEIDMHAARRRLRDFVAREQGK